MPSFSNFFALQIALSAPTLDGSMGIMLVFFTHFGRMLVFFCGTVVRTF
jgi:hypothetical protein